MHRRHIPRRAPLGFVLLGLAVLNVDASAALRPSRPPLPETYAELLQLAHAIAVVEVTAVDSRQTAFDGPFWVTARVRKHIDGTLPDGETLIFSDTASFKGAHFRRGDLRIVFLVEIKANARWSKQSDWATMVLAPPRGRPTVKTGFFVDETDIPGVDVKSLGAFLRQLDQDGDRPAHVLFPSPGP